jgi:hypothetical protein
MRAGHRQRVAGGQPSLPWRPSRSVSDLVGPAGAEFAHLLPPLTVAEKLPGLLPFQPELNFFGSGQRPQFWSGNWVLASNTLPTAGRPFNHARVYCGAVKFKPGVPPPTPPNPQKYLHACLAQARAYLLRLREILTRPPAGAGRSRR